MVWWGIQAKTRVVPICLMYHISPTLTVLWIPTSYMGTKTDKAVVLIAHFLPLEAATIQVKRGESPRWKKLFLMMRIGKTKNIIDYRRTSEMRLILPRWSRNTPGSLTSCKLLMTRSSYIGQFSTLECLNIKEFSWKKSNKNSRKTFENKRLNMRPKWIRWTKNLKRKWPSNSKTWGFLRLWVSLKARQLRVHKKVTASNSQIK